jgi:hypothetical protein
MNRTRFLSDTNLLADGEDASSAAESLEGKVVVATVGQPISVV